MDEAYAIHAAASVMAFGLAVSYSFEFNDNGLSD